MRVTAQTEYEAAARPRRHRGRSWLIVLIVLLGLLVAADRISVAYAQSTLATKIQQKQNLTQKPDVVIGGIPFLTQVAARDFSHVTVDIRGLVASGIPIAQLHATLTGVHVSSGYNSATADTVNASAVLDDASLSAALTNRAGLGQVVVSQGSNGRLKATFNILGLSASAQIAATLLPDNVVELKSLAVNGLLSKYGFNAPAGFDVKLSLGSLPFRMQITDLQVDSGDVKVTADGHNVPLAGATLTQ